MSLYITGARSTGYVYEVLSRLGIDLPRIYPRDTSLFVELDYEVDSQGTIGYIRGRGQYTYSPINLSEVERVLGRVDTARNWAAYPPHIFGVGRSRAAAQQINTYPVNF